MIERIRNVIKYSQLSPSAFADTIGISRSGLTHLLTGRNQPSLDVARKILAKFPDVSTEWLIMGMGEMLRPEEQSVAVSDDGNAANMPSEYPVENLKSDRQINLFSDFDNAAESEMDDEVGIVPDREKEVQEPVAQNADDNMVQPAAPQPTDADVSSAVNMVAQPNVRKISEPRQTAPVKRERRQPGVALERKLQKIVFFYDDHSFEVYNNI